MQKDMITKNTVNILTQEVMFLILGAIIQTMEIIQVVVPETTTSHITDISIAEEKQPYQMV